MQMARSVSLKTSYKTTLVAGYIGYITQAIVNNLAPLLFLIFRDSFGVSLEKITLLTTLNFLIQLFVDFLSAKFVDRIGYRRCVVAAHLFCAAGLVGMAVLPFILGSAYAGLLASLTLYAVGGGLIEVLISPIVEACPTENKASAMSLLHSFYCWGTVAVILLSTLFLHIAGKGSWRVLPCVWALVPLCNAALFSQVPIATLTEKDEGMTVKDLFRSGLFWLFVLLMVASGASEQGMSQWASAFAESGLHISKTAGDLFGPCLFSVLMGTARVLYAKYGGRMDLTRFLIASGTLCAFSYLLASLSPSPVFSLSGCVLCGFSVGIMWPGVFSVASVSMPKGGTALFALLALAGDLGCSAGPTAVGFAAGLMGDELKKGLLAGIVFPVMLIVCAGLLMKRNKTVMSRK